MFQDYYPHTEQDMQHDGYYMPFMDQEDGPDCPFPTEFLGGALTGMPAPAPAPSYLSIGIPPRVDWPSPRDGSPSHPDSAFPSPLSSDFQPSPTDSPFEDDYSPSMYASPLPTPYQGTFFYTVPNAAAASHMSHHHPPFHYDAYDNDPCYFPRQSPGPFVGVDTSKRLCYPANGYLDPCSCTPSQLLVSPDMSYSTTTSSYNNNVNSSSTSSNTTNDDDGYPLHTSHATSSTLASASCSSPPDTPHPYPRAQEAVHMQSEIRPYPCYICHRAFARKHDLQRHIRVHTGAKPYVCLCCKKRFARTDALKRHLRMEEACRSSPEIQALKKAGKRRYRNL